MTDTLGVKITADVVDLQAKIAVAKAEVAGFNSTLRDAAKQAASSGMTDAIKAQLTAAAESAVEAQAKLANLRSELGNSGSGFSSFARAIEEANAPMASLANLAAKGAEIFGVGLAVDKVTELARGFADLGDQIARAMVTTGMSAEQLSALRVAAAENDVEFGGLTRAMTTFARNIQEAESGSKKQAAAFQALGISSADLKAKGNDLGGMLELVAERLNVYADGGNKAALESAVFGGRIQGLAPILADIAQNGMAGLQQHAAELGQLFSGPMAEAAEKAHKNFVDFGLSVNALGNEIGEHLLPFVTQAINELNALFSAGNSTAVVAQLNAELQTTQAQIDAAKARLADDNIFRRFFDDKIIQDDQARIAEIQKQLADLRNQAGQQIKIPEMPQPEKPQAPSLDSLSNTGAASELEKFRQSLAEMEAEWNGTHTAMLAEAATMWQNEVKNATLSEKEKTQAMTSAANARRESDQAQAAESQQLNKLDADNTVAIGKVKIQAERDTLDAQVAAGQITAQQKVATLQKLADEEYQLDLKRLEDELSTLNQLPVEYKRVYDQILVLKAQHEAQMAQLTLQGAQAQKADIDKLTKDYEQAFQPIGSAFNNTIKGMISGTTTWRQAELNLANSVVNAFIDDAEKMATHWIAKEIAETMATQEGVAARTAAESAGSSAGLATMATNALKQITTSAASAAANVYSDVSAIPYVGWLLAPPAAAAAFVAVEAFGGSVASAAGGMLEVPYDNFLISAHKQEMMLPAAIANPMRDFFATGGGGGTSTGGGGGTSTGGGAAPIINVQFTHNGGGNLDQPTINRYARQIAEAVGKQFTSNPSIRPTY